MTSPVPHEHRRERRHPEIRPAVEADSAALAALAGELGYPVGADAMAHRLARVLERDDHLVLITCTEHGEPVGWIEVAERCLLESEGRCEILGLVVSARDRRQGRAARLVATAEDWAARRGRREITVRSNIARTESHPFYERLAYTRAKTQHVYRKSLTAD